MRSLRALAGGLNERQRRLWAASEARAAGRGGVTATFRATGMAVDTIRKGSPSLSLASGLVGAGASARRGSQAIDGDRSDVAG